MKAAEKLFDEHNIDPQSIDYLLLCTQTPDYPLPTTACLVQHRLGLRTGIGAIDFNLGCSGFVYGLSLADGLIRTGEVKRVLLITAETYSKLIDPEDRSLRTIFGDGAAATLIEACDEPSMTSFEFGTDGSGADTLIAAEGGFRPKEDAIPPRHRHRWKSNLYMDGPSLINFTVSAIPSVIDQILQRENTNKESSRHILVSSSNIENVVDVAATDRCSGRAIAYSLRESWKHRLVNDTHFDFSTAGERRVEAGHEIHHDGLWRRLVLGRVHVERNVCDIDSAVASYFVAALIQSRVLHCFLSKQLTHWSLLEKSSCVD